jgi:hypothetical protein
MSATWQPGAVSIMRTNTPAFVDVQFADQAEVVHVHLYFRVIKVRMAAIHM